MLDVLRGPVLRMVEGDEREQQRASEGVLSQRKGPEQGFGEDAEEKPGADERQAQESSWIQISYGAVRI